MSTPSIRTREGAWMSAAVSRTPGIRPEHAAGIPPTWGNPGIGPVRRPVDERISRGFGRAVRRGPPGRHGRGRTGGGGRLRTPLPAAGLRLGLLHDERSGRGRGRGAGGHDQGLAACAGVRPPSWLGHLMGPDHHPQPGDRRAATAPGRPDRSRRFRHRHAGRQRARPRGRRRAGRCPPDRPALRCACCPTSSVAPWSSPPVYGRTALEISESEGIPLGTAKTRIRTALIRLRAAIEQAEGVNDER